jgi:hypothetical protein
LRQRGVAQLIFKVALPEDAFFPRFIRFLVAESISRHEKNENRENGEKPAKTVRKRSNNGGLCLENGEKRLARCDGAIVPDGGADNAIRRTDAGENAAREFELQAFMVVFKVCGGLLDWLCVVKGRSLIDTLYSTTCHRSSNLNDGWPIFAKNFTNTDLMYRKPLPRLKFGRANFSFVAEKRGIPSAREGCLQPATRKPQNSLPMQRRWAFDRGDPRAF